MKTANKLITILSGLFLNQIVTANSVEFLNLKSDYNSITTYQHNWFFINAYGGISYHAYPNKSQETDLNENGGYYNIFTPADKLSPFYELKFGIQPFKYFSIAFSYWNAGNISSPLKAYDGEITYDSGTYEMSLSGFNAYLTGHIPLESLNSQFLISAGPALVFSKFKQSENFDNENNDLSNKNFTSIRPFIAIEYQYNINNSFTVNLAAEYLFGTGSNVYQPYYNEKYVPNLFNLSIGLGYHF